MMQNLENTIVREGASGLAKWTTRVVLVICGSAFLALCARASVPLPFTPVPVSLSNFGVLLLALLLGSRLSPAAVILYLIEGAAGLPVFSNGSLGLLGPTGGYLLAYPAAAFIAALLFERGAQGFLRAATAVFTGEIVIFAGGIAWLSIGFHVPLAQAAHWGLYPFLFAELAKIAAAAGIATRLAPRKNF